MKKSSLKKDVLAIISVVFTISCKNFFAPILLVEQVATDLIITEQRILQETLQNYRYAYIFKDSLLYSGLLDGSFIMVCFDPNIGISGQFVSLGHDLDLKTTGQLFRKYDIFDLVWNSPIYESVQISTGQITKSF